MCFPQRKGKCDLEDVKFLIYIIYVFSFKTLISIYYPSSFFFLRRTEQWLFWVCQVWSEQKGFLFRTFLQHTHNNNNSGGRVWKAWIVILIIRGKKACLLRGCGEYYSFCVCSGEILRLLTHWAILSCRRWWLEGRLEVDTDISMYFDLSWSSLCPFSSSISVETTFTHFWPNQFSQFLSTAHLFLHLLTSHSVRIVWD